MDVRQQALDLLEALKAGEGYAAQLPRGHLIVFPVGQVRGLPHTAGLVVCQTGKGTLVLDDPNHFNKFVFVSAGFDMQVGEYATDLIKTAMRLSQGPERPQLTDER